jgi:uncharacterized membrane protein YhhN
VPVTLLVVAAVAAVVDWLAVYLRLFRIEYAAKPATMALLASAAAVSDLGPARGWIVAALAFGLLGDVGLMLSAGRTDPPFLAGLGAFLAGHVCYLVGFATAGLRGLAVVAGALIVAGMAALALPAVLRGAQRAAGGRFAAVVGCYAGVLSLMTVFGVGTAIVLTAVGAVLFMTSDTLIGRDRFVRRIRHGPLLIIVTYHLAQFLIVIGLIEAA